MLTLTDPEDELQCVCGLPVWTSRLLACAGRTGAGDPIHPQHEASPRQWAWLACGACAGRLVQPADASMSRATPAQRWSVAQRECDRATQWPAVACRRPSRCSRRRALALGPARACFTTMARPIPISSGSHPDPIPHSYMAWTALFNLDFTLVAERYPRLTLLTSLSWGAQYLILTVLLPLTFAFLTVLLIKDLTSVVWILVLTASLLATIFVIAAKAILGAEQSNPAYEVYLQQVRASPRAACPARTPVLCSASTRAAPFGGGGLRWSPNCPRFSTELVLHASAPHDPPLPPPPTHIAAVCLDCPQTDFILYMSIVSLFLCAASYAIKKVRSCERARELHCGRAPLQQRGGARHTGARDSRNWPLLMRRLLAAHPSSPRADLHAAREEPHLDVRD